LHMKKILIAGGLLFILNLAQAQQKEGKIVYERVSQMQITFSGMNEEMQRMIPRSRTDKFELTFGNNQSLWKSAEPDNEDETMGGEGNGFQVRMVAAGSNDVLYNNFETGKRVELREMFDKKFIIDDSIRPLKWKMTGETKTILNHSCMKATSTRISQRPQTTMVDGKMERKEVTDTSTIVAWFASDIPVPAGPAEFQGQLPGLILEMDVNNGRQVFRALELAGKADLAVIKEPTGKKHYTQEEFRKEREKMMEEMQRNNNGRRVIRIN
jgi:GLPGLI family protein